MVILALDVSCAFDFAAAQINKDSLNAFPCVLCGYFSFRCVFCLDFTAAAQMNKDSLNALPSVLCGYFRSRCVFCLDCT